MEECYAIGIDFGTLSARALLIDVGTGEEISTAIYGYQDAVIDRVLPETGVDLPVDFALQNPADYRDAAEGLLQELCKNSGINPKKIISPA